MTRIIGISGCTSSGKTTLTKLLCLSVANSVAIGQDDFYLPLSSGRLEYLPELAAYNLDSPISIDFERLIEQVRSLIDRSEYEFIFVEGSLIYSDAELSSLIDKKYFICLSKEECRLRRTKRRYSCPDPADYFDKCVWPEYLKYQQYCLANHDDIVYINGSKTIESIFELILNDIRI